MTPHALLHDLLARGFTLQDRGGVLLVAPGRALSDADRDQVRRHREALLALLDPAADRHLSWPMDSPAWNGRGGDWWHRRQADDE